MAQIKIDTKYARRDVKRIRTAIAYLENAYNEYSQLNNFVNDTYKGEAANALSTLITANRMKRVQNMISDLRGAQNRLQRAIDSYERASENVKKSVEG